MTLTPEIWHSLIGVAVLVAIAVTVLSVAGVGHQWSAAAAVCRGAVQLALISVVLTGVITDPRWVTLALLVMFTVAAVTSTHRTGWTLPRFLVVTGAMAAGVTTVLGVVFLTGAIEFSSRYALAIGGIIIGGAMSTATLAGRRLAQATEERWSEVEGWLALGATPRQATRKIARFSIREALIPSTDQTKTTGLVTLPGAFVGAIFGGVSPLDAGRFQIVVLAGIMAAGAVTAAVIAVSLAPTLHRAAG
ncbi:ABC transporter permease [Corynebacterium glyciniphilum]|uniref:ABC transporter permease n=1 Tax=Corynebacterium glyciniphilum TaxID=1404244 RepID=UPI002652C34A|nr:ABC transporter permease [Corynebacterium glyciniphilum]MDN5683636.1 ABC transporter permease [Corynebacterium glyciniphilum]MDN6704537.1 ABC transporter permease [Corynebacterium glyciniphilum]